MKVEYSEDKRMAFFDGYKFRRDAKTGYYLSTKPTDIGHRERLHCYVWRHFNGPIKTDYHVHHADADKGHNDIENLRCIPGRLHRKHHSSQRAALEYDALLENLIKNAVPKAAEWHKSPAGRAWHKENNKFSYEIVEKTCEYCGKPYKTVWHGNNKFCGNNCRAAARRKSGVDNETRICAICGGEFTTNKYTNTRCCSQRCSTELRWNKERKVRGEVPSI